VRRRKRFSGQPCTPAGRRRPTRKVPRQRHILPTLNCRVDITPNPDHGGEIYTTDNAAPFTATRARVARNGRAPRSLGHATPCPHPCSIDPFNSYLHSTISPPLQAHMTEGDGSPKSRPGLAGSSVCGRRQEDVRREAPDRALRPTAQCARVAPATAVPGLAHPSSSQGGGAGDSRCTVQRRACK
jgi:hypothetical protein